MKQMDHQHINTALLNSIHGDTVTAEHYRTQMPNYDTHFGQVMAKLNAHCEVATPVHTQEPL